MPTTRHTLVACAITLLACLRTSAQETKPTLPITGPSSKSLAPIDDMMAKFMTDNKVPGGVLAVARDGKLLYARGFGYSDVDKKEPVNPDSLFRIASISKPITAVAVWQLIEQGKLKLDDKAFSYIELQPHLEKDAKPDDRLKQITILNLLQHTGGWDRNKSFDPMFIHDEISKSMNIPCPADRSHIIRYMMGKPLQFDPGQGYNYSNFGYCVLGRIMEKITGQPYDVYVNEKILKPLGIADMKIGGSLIEQRADREVRYYAALGGKGKGHVGNTVGKRVPWAYGVWSQEAMDAHGGWIATAPDLVKFAAAFDDYDKCPLLKSDTIKQMFARPDGPAGLNKEGKPKPRYNGAGWLASFNEPTGRYSAWHGGHLGGCCSTLLVHRYDNLSWAVMFNQDNTPIGQSLATVIDRKLHETIDSIKDWPTEDLFTDKTIFHK